MSTKILRNVSLLVIAGAALCACTTVPEAPAQAATAAPVSATASATTSTAASGDNITQVSAEEETVCKRVPKQFGSRFKTRVCKPASEWSTSTAAAKAFEDSIKNDGFQTGADSVNSPGGQGGFGGGF